MSWNPFQTKVDQKWRVLISACPFSRKFYSWNPALTFGSVAEKIQKSVISDYKKQVETNTLYVYMGFRVCYQSK